MWSTKWILPEHREALIEEDRHLNDFAKPTLDEQEIQIVDAVIRGSLHTKGQVKLWVYDTNKYRIVTGTVERIDQQLKRVKIVLFQPFEVDPDIEWIDIGDINKAEAVESTAWTDDEKDAWLEAEQNDTWDELEWDRDESVDS